MWGNPLYLKLWFILVIYILKIFLIDLKNLNFTKNQFFSWNCLNKLNFNKPSPNLSKKRTEKIRAAPERHLFGFKYPKISVFRFM